MTPPEVLRFKGKLVEEMTREELVEALLYAVDVRNMMWSTTEPATAPRSEDPSRRDLARRMVQMARTIRDGQPFGMGGARDGIGLMWQSLASFYEQELMMLTGIACPGCALGLTREPNTVPDPHKRFSHQHPAAAPNQWKMEYCWLKDEA